MPAQPSDKRRETHPHIIDVGAIKAMVVQDKVKLTVVVLLPHHHCMAARDEVPENQRVNVHVSCSTTTKCCSPQF